MSQTINYKTTILAFGNNAGIEVPESELMKLGAGKRPKVRVSVNNSYQFDTTVASRGGKYLLSFSKERRDATGLSAGDSVYITLELL